MAVSGAQVSNPAAQDVESLQQLIQQAFDPKTAKTALTQIYQRMDLGNADKTIIADFFNRKFRVVPDHMQKKVASETQESSTADINDLLKMFREINFTDTKKPGYYDPKNLKERDWSCDWKQLDQGFSQFLYCVINKCPHPRLRMLDEISRNQLYDELHRDLKKFTHLLAKVEDAYTKAESLVSLLIATHNHGPARWQAEIRQICHMLQMGDAPRQTLEANVLEYLTGVRAEKLCQLGEQNVHQQNYNIKAIGKQIGMPGAELFDHIHDPFIHNTTSPEALYAAFTKLYPSYVVFTSVMDCLQISLKKDPAMVTKWFTDHKIADWKNESLRTEAIVQFTLQSGILAEADPTGTK